MMQTLAMPEALLPFAGQIVDIDTHEQMPAQCWVEQFGPVAEPFAKAVMSVVPDNPNHANVADYPGDIRPIEPQTIWSHKGPTSPGAADPHRRIEVMDLTGIRKQLLFPTGIGLWAFSLFQTTEDNGPFPMFKGRARRDYAKQMWGAYNSWAVRTTKVSPRISVVAPIYGETVDELMEVTGKLIDQGIRAVWIGGGTLPAGKSPAHPDLDAFYRMLAGADVTLTHHIAGEFGFMATTKWRDAPAFEGFKATGEQNLDPWTLATIHLASQNFLTAMVTGGVFERHPNLRFGVLEVGAYWIGPLAFMLDFWHDSGHTIGMKKYGDWNGRKLPMRPSEYIRRNVRVSPYDFEPVDTYVDQYRLEEVYCFASDYPHVEGGKDPMNLLVGRVERLGESYMRKFFVTNGEWLMPN